MKPFVVLCLLGAAILPVPTTTAAIDPAAFEVSGSTEYREGWKQGWREGYRHVAGKRALMPLVPMPPMPQLGADSWQDGYNDGFVAGRKAAGG